MMYSTDFSKKQIAVVFFNEGEKISFSNENMIVKDKEGNTKLQSTCYRLFLIMAVGHFSITSAIIQQSHKYGFFIALFTPGFRLYQVIGAKKDGNTLLKRKQYLYDGNELARYITMLKIQSQIDTLNAERRKTDEVFEDISKMRSYIGCIGNTEDLNSMMAYEGLSSKLYFKDLFNTFQWQGRQPRLKKDIYNATLDIGYTILFAFVETILDTFGFDTYCGVLHRQFYMRQSLVCDIMEPFRTIVDKSVRKAVNLKMVKSDDFILINNQYRLKWERNSYYVKFLLSPLMENRNEIFKFIREYYRCFMKGKNIESYPLLKNGEVAYGNNQL